jgi:hypothetical protein
MSLKTRGPVKFCWTCGRRYRDRLGVTCARCPRLLSRPYPKRAPLRRATAASQRFERDA